MDDTQVYIDHKRLIEAQARAIARGHGLDVEECTSVANETFVKCLRSWCAEKSNGAKFSTYLTRCLQWNLYRFAREEHEHAHGTAPLPDIVTDSEGDSIDDALLHVTLESLSRDARVCANLALNPPPEMLDLNKTSAQNRERDTAWSKRLTKTLISRYLKRYEGWSERRCTRAFHEIACALAA